MKPRKPDPLPRIRIQLSPSDLLDPIDLRDVTAGGKRPETPNDPKPPRAPEDRDGPQSGVSGIDPG